jgi:hypothetical protein
VTHAVAPPKPSNTSWMVGALRVVGRHEAVRTYRVSWSEPAGYADQFLLYNTVECPRGVNRKNANTPCFVAGTPVDVSKLELLAKAPGVATSMKVHLAEGECGASYGTILLRARNAYGQSAFAVVTAALVPDPNDIIC